MLEDLKSAFRSLRKSPGFTAVALTVLALGIGSSTAIFSVVDAVFLRGLPFDEHDRLVVVLEHDPQRPTTFGSGTTTPQMYIDWRREQRPFEDVAAVGGMVFHMRNDRGEPDRIWGQRVSWEFFPVLRVSPLLGRTFTSEDEILGRHRVLLLSYGAWQRRFGGAPDVLGKTLELSEETWQVVGVLPPNFSYPVGSARPAEVFAPLAFRENERTREGAGRNYNWLVIGRLKSGLTIEQAHEQMDSLAAALDEQHPKWSPGRRTRVVPLHEHLVGRVRTWMLLLLGAVGLVLLIACANVANLMLARSTARAREIAVRAALGASRWRLIRGLLVESVVLSLSGATIGLVLALHGTDVLRTWLPANVPRVADIGIDLRVLSAAILAAVATGIAFGMAPAVQASRLDLMELLKAAARSTAGPAGQRMRNALVVVEVALAVLLLVGAGLFAGSFTRLIRIDPGFDHRNLLAVDVGVRVNWPNYEDALQRGGPYIQQMLEAVAAVPGIEAAGAVSGGVPFSGGWSRSPVSLPGRGALPGDGMNWEDDSIDKRIISPGYLQLLRIPLRRGRYLNAEDRREGEPVVVTNEAAARKYWPGQDAIGQRITIEKVERTVVGIVGDIRHLGPETPPRQEAYIPLAQERTTGATLVMRTREDPLNLLPLVKAAIWRVNPDQRMFADIHTLEGHMDRLIAQRRFNMALLGLLGVLGLVIAAVGVYGVMAYVVAQRTNEIGVRMALGATPKNIVGMVLGQATSLIVAGLVIGGAAAWFLSSGVSAFLFQVEPHDTAVFALAVSTLALAGLLASVIPARRAARVDPMITLRQE